MNTDHERAEQVAPPVRSSWAIEFGTEEIMRFGVKRARITHPDGAPFDGKPVLIKLASGWVEAWWEEGYSHHGEVGGESGGFQWICLDDQFQAEFDQPSHWSPLPEAMLDLLTAAKLQEAAEAFHLSCAECEGNEIPELCEACFPHYDDARIARRAAIAKATMPAPPDEQAENVDD